jgi:hypothetical protein
MPPYSGMTPLSDNDIPKWCSAVGGTCVLTWPVMADD